MGSQGANHDRSNGYFIQVLAFTPILPLTFPSLLFYSGTLENNILFLNQSKVHHHNFRKSKVGFPSNDKFPSKVCWRNTVGQTAFGEGMDR